MKRLARFWPEILLLSAIALLFGVLMSSCEGPSARQAAAAKAAAGAAGTVVGLPPVVGESIAGLVLMAISAFAGHKHGRRKERASKAS